MGLHFHEAIGITVLTAVGASLSFTRQSNAHPVVNSRWNGDVQSNGFGHQTCHVGAKGTTEETGLTNGRTALLDGTIRRLLRGKPVARCHSRREPFDSDARPTEALQPSEMVS